MAWHPSSCLTLPARSLTLFSWFWHFWNIVHLSNHSPLPSPVIHTLTSRFGHHASSLRSLLKKWNFCCGCGQKVSKRKLRKRVNYFRKYCSRNSAIEGSVSMVPMPQRVLSHSSTSGAHSLALCPVLHPCLVWQGSFKDFSNLWMCLKQSCKMSNILHGPES